MSAEIVIIVIGPTGSGKSNFINKLTGMKEEEGAKGLESCTQKIRVFKVSNCCERYMFLDTPGFDDTYRSDRVILQMIAEWLEKNYRSLIKLSGVIYTHDITKTRMTGTMCKNLLLLGQLCGAKAAERVRLVTTMWDRLEDQRVASSRAQQLEGNFWKPLIMEGARHKKFNNTPESAWDIIHDVTGDAEALLLQEELVDVERKLNETAAGKALYTPFEKLLQEKKDTIKQLSDEAKAQQDPALAKKLEAEYKRIEAQLQKTWVEMEKPKISFMRRIMLFFGKKTKEQTIEMNSRAP
ncbi:P-loop containing nucleoside triphosphate hydrolase protein [Scleroderma citrinum]